QADQSADPREINMSDLGQDERAEWQRPRHFSQTKDKQLRPHPCLQPMLGPNLGHCSDTDR
ncbi:MAG: hypothetical protein ACKPKO_51275, partial [Candidatus Fonsibacter sp.]